MAKPVFFDKFVAEISAGLRTERFRNNTRFFISWLCILCISASVLVPVIQAQTTFNQEYEMALDSEWSKVPDTEDVQDEWGMVAEDGLFPDESSSRTLGYIYHFMQLYGYCKVTVPPPRA